MYRYLGPSGRNAHRGRVLQTFINAFYAGLPANHFQTASASIPIGEETCGLRFKSTHGDYAAMIIGYTIVFSGTTFTWMNDRESGSIEPAARRELVTDGYILVCSIHNIPGCFAQDTYPLYGPITCEPIPPRLCQNLFAVGTFHIQHIRFLPDFFASYRHLSAFCSKATAAFSSVCESSNAQPILTVILPPG